MTAEVVCAIEPLDQDRHAADSIGLEYAAKRLNEIRGGLQDHANAGSHILAATAEQRLHALAHKSDRDAAELEACASDVDHRVLLLGWLAVAGAHHPARTAGTLTGCAPDRRAAEVKSGRLVAALSLCGATEHVASVRRTPGQRVKTGRRITDMSRVVVSKEALDAFIQYANEVRLMCDGEFLASKSEYETSDAEFAKLVADLEITGG